MLWLNNSELNVAVLDPAADQARFGTRYCTAGYIWQITDHRLDDLLTGPTYPYDFFAGHGAGIPDAFQNPLGNPDKTDDPLLLGLGIGIYDKPSNTVREWAAWDIKTTPTALTFSAKQTLYTWSLELTRTLTLIKRTLKSETRVKNTGAGLIPVRWYPHPFFPLPPSGETCKLNVPVTIPENNGYELLPNGFIGQKNLPWDGKGYFQVIDIPKDRPVTFLQKHPKLGLIAATIDYAPVWMPIWGNANTFSFEPYYEKALNPGDETAWSMTYDF
jgi:hypothetical protein